MPTGISPSITLCKGAFARSADEGEISDSTSASYFAGENDYLVLNSSKVLSDITWDDIDFIRDA